MKHTTRWLAQAPLLVFASCLSSSPPSPPVRWFDPRPAAVAAGAATRPAVDLRVTAAAHLGREFVVRTAPRELVFDNQHGWIDDPAQLVASAIGTRLDLGGRSDRSGGSFRTLQVAVEAFELDVQAEPRAVVRLLVSWTGGRQELAVQEPAADRSPAAFATAMAVALARVARDVAALASKG
jgi:ABC-type uncharacterized transport system auxiliary subunit